MAELALNPDKYRLSSRCKAACSVCGHREKARGWNDQCCCISLLCGLAKKNKPTSKPLGRWLFPLSVKYPGWSCPLIAHQVLQMEPREPLYRPHGWPPGHRSFQLSPWRLPSSHLVKVLLAAVLIGAPGRWSPAAETTWGGQPCTGSPGRLVVQDVPGRWGCQVSLNKT